MNKQSATGTALVFSNTIANTAANTIGVAKTGIAISSLHGAAHTSATAAWVGFGSMNLGMFMMGAFPVLGAAILLDNLRRQEHESQKHSTQWEKDLAYILNENLRQAKLPKLQEEQKRRDEFWRQRDAER